MQPEENKVPPKHVFIVPYRNRVQHKFFFSKYMSFLLEDKDDYEIYFSHQCDVRTFNRGATKNIGFLAVKNKYPEHYQDINFIFNDVDTIPFNKIFNYETTKGVVKHYYGYNYALGGIVVMKGFDFERINGFPCFWGWGMEDNCLQKRCLHYGLTIDRSIFYAIGSPEILQLFDGISRIISKKDPWRMERDDGMDGIKTIHKLNYQIDSQSANQEDNLFEVDNKRIFFINIKTFLTHLRFEQDQYYQYDLREPKRKIVQPNKLKEAQQTVIRTDDWSNIPYYPTMKERRENIARLLMSQGKQIPPALLQQIEQDKMKEYQDDVFNKPIVSQNRNTRNISTNQNNGNFNNGNNNSNINNSENMCAKEMIQQSRMQQPSQQQQQQQYYNSNQSTNQTAHLFSREYAQHQPKSQAMASARIRLGGVF
jgi:hypothetical protein